MPNWCFKDQQWVKIFRVVAVTMCPRDATKQDYTRKKKGNSAAHPIADRCG
jgi:hypothetical protein